MSKIYLGANMERLGTQNRFAPYSKVIVWYDDENAFTAGDDSGRTLEAYCPFATQAIADKMLDAIKGYAYQPYEAIRAILDPAAELGDGVTANGTYSVLGRIETTFNALCIADVAAPADEEIDHEMPYQSPTQRALKRKVTLGKSYYGTQISRGNGLEVTKMDADGNEVKRAQFNADVLAMYDEDGKARVYFDTETGRFKFVGDLDISGGNINLSKGSIDWGENYPESDLPDYIHNSYIGPTIIRSPTIEANEFNVEPSDVDDYNGAFNIYGMQLGARYHMLAIQYQGYNDAVTPYVDIYSPGGADFCFNRGGAGVTPIKFFGTVDFSNATVIGL